MKYDISIIGGGIVGGMICRNLALQYPTKKIALLEKEKDVLQ
jgi:L-2-hydroxyglutarate oxidase LhgO